MGYVRERPIHKLVFDDPSMQGLTVRVRAISFRDADTIGDRVRDEDTGEILRDKVAKEFFTDGVFLDWDLQHPDGSPVSGTVEGLYSQDTAFVDGVLLGWLASIGQTMPAPLDGPSPDTGRSELESSMPMEVTSPDPPN